MTTPVELIERLASHGTLARAPRDQLEWVAARGEVRRYGPGETATSSTKPAEELLVVLTGHLSIRVDRGAGSRKIIEWRAGEVTGLLPYSRLIVPPGDVVAEEPTELLALHRRHFAGLIRECGELTTILVHVMLDRARHFTSSELHDEKMTSLGRLAAGLAHELNNPASAAVRTASGLVRCIAEVADAARALGAAGLGSAELTAIDRLRTAGGPASAGAARHSLERADRIDAVADWLDQHGLDERLADALAEGPLTTDDLDELARLLGRDTLPLAVAYLTAESQARGLALDIERAAARVHALVSAVKRFSYMDRAPVPAPVDVREGLSDTLMMLNAKARARSAQLTLDVGPGLPQVEAYGGELNQIWMNLIENALDAVPEGGRVQVSARLEGDRVVVRVVDDGPGIPPAIRDRIFDPFFTTKPVGQGTGLGLEIVRRLAARHDAWLDVESRPGRTEFRVSLRAGDAGGNR